jgi:hypothetical protein
MIRDENGDFAPVVPGGCDRDTPVAPMFNVLATDALADGRTRLIIDIPLASLEEQAESALRLLQWSATFRGFRPGALPAGEIARRFGRQLHDGVMAIVIGRVLAHLAHPGMVESIDILVDDAVNPLTIAAYYQPYAPELVQAMEQLQRGDPTKLRELVAESTADDVHIASVFGRIADGDGE